MRLLDASPDGVGEIVIRGHNVMKGYWNRPRARRAPCCRTDGWLRTGDLARVDDDGAFRIVGRSKDLIIRDGRNVHPREIEDVLHGHPEVLEAAVLGVPTRCSARRSSPASSAPARRSPRRSCATTCASASPSRKYPRRVWFAPALPHSRTGKLLKRAIVIPPDIAAAREIAA